jgi:hypothetical protein
MLLAALMGSDVLPAVSDSQWLHNNIENAEECVPLVGLHAAGFLHPAQIRMWK